MKYILTILLVGINLISFSQSTVCVTSDYLTKPFVAGFASDSSNYTKGSTLLEAGDIKFKIPNIYMKTVGYLNSPNVYQSFSKDSLFYIGDVAMDVSASLCTSKELTFSATYFTGLMVDGDSILGLEMQKPIKLHFAKYDLVYDGKGRFVVSGDFNEVVLYSVTNFLFGVCYTCKSSLGLSENDPLGFQVFPNPIENSLNIKIPVELVRSNFNIIDYTGKIVQQGNLNNAINNIEVDQLKSGIYFLEIEGSVQRIKFSK